MMLMMAKEWSELRQDWPLARVCFSTVNRGQEARVLPCGMSIEGSVSSKLMDLSDSWTWRSRGLPFRPVRFQSKTR